MLHFLTFLLKKEKDNHFYEYFSLLILCACSGWAGWTCISYMKVAHTEIPFIHKGFFKIDFNIIYVNLILL